MNPTNDNFQSKGKIIFTLLVSFLILSFLSQILLAQDDVKKRVFEEVDDLFSKAKAKQADLLSPEYFKIASEKHAEALKDFDKNKNINDKLGAIKKYLNQALEVAKLGHVTFSTLLESRDDALSTNAPEYASNIFEKAENDFFDAARTLEKGNVNKTKEKAIVAEKRYREAELIAIKGSIIGHIRELQENAKKEKVDKFAPISYNRSITLLNETETLLNSDRRAKTEAKQKAENAEYEAKHAIYLADRIQELKKDDSNWEKLILEHEEYFTKVLIELGFEPRFDQGFSEPTTSALKAIQSLQKQNKELSDEISALDQQVESLINQKNALEVQLSELKEKEEGLITRLTMEQKRKEKFQKIESMFDREEAQIFREGEKIRIRLIGLNFASGKSVINPEYFPLLTKLQRAIRIFPDYILTIEGHTDNRGDDRMNESLSTKRAKAVRDYLKANMGLTSDQISAVGYGESKPIATNETEDGRRQNRRIDVVMEPSE